MEPFNSNRRRRRDFDHLHWDIPASIEFSAPRLRLISSTRHRPRYLITSSSSSSKEFPFSSFAIALFFHRAFCHGNMSASAQPSTNDNKSPLVDNKSRLYLLSNYLLSHTQNQILIGFIRSFSRCASCRRRLIDGVSHGSLRVNQHPSNIFVIVSVMWNVRSRKLSIDPRKTLQTSSVRISADKNSSEWTFANQYLSVWRLRVRFGGVQTVLECGKFV